MKQTGETTAQKVNSESFNIVSVIGEGAYGKVLLVKKRDTQELYAMKIIKKKKFDSQKDLVCNEKNILLETTGSPFLVSLCYSFQTATALCLVMEFCPGGDLINFLAKKRKFSELLVKFYAVQLVLALEYLHSKNILHRDLKPDNVLICADGYIKILDFGLSKKKVESQDVKSLHGTVVYLAPEVVNGDPYDKEVDWWALGIFIYQMYEGDVPFDDNDNSKVYEMIKKDKPKFNREYKNELKDLILRLLEKDFRNRLGHQNGAQEVKAHPWFSGINWEDIAQKKIPAPYLPTLLNADDTSHFEKRFTKMPIELSAPSHQEVSVPFSNFSYDADHAQGSETVMQQKRD